MITRRGLACALTATLIAVGGRASFADPTTTDMAALPVTTYVQIKLKKPIGLDEMREKYKAGLAWMRTEEGRQAGVLRKYSIRADDGMTIGGVYLMESMPKAVAFIPEDEKEKMRAKYDAAEVVVTHYVTPAILDNLAGATLVGDQVV